jgi:iron complex transport system permease protein
MFLLIMLLALVLVLSLGVGAVFVPPGRVLNALLHPSDPGVKPTDIAIIRDLRLARVLLAALIGAGLAAAGAAFQGLFRNPLADPYVVGASGGAALGASIAIVGGMTWRIAGLGPVPLAAFVGSLLAVFLVYFIAEMGGGSSAVALTLLSAITSLLMLVRDTTLHEVFAWTMGGLSGRSWPHLWNNGPYMLIGLGALWLLARPLDALAFGEETAESLGLPLSRARGALVAAASLTTAAAVATGGIIGFVGLIAPHAARLIFGATHHRLIPASALVGALLLLLADDLARTVLAPIELPVGIVTSLLGGTFFLYLLKTRQQELRGGR